MHLVIVWQESGFLQLLGVYNEAHSRQEENFLPSKMSSIIYIIHQEVARTSILAKRLPSAYIWYPPKQYSFHH